MKKIKLKEVIRFFPITVQHAEIVSRKEYRRELQLAAWSYQSDQVNSQQLYKPISKIIRFQ